jgi:hypothetical protein
MAQVNAFNAQLTATLLEDSTTVLTSPGSEETGAVEEVHGGLPQLVAGSATDVNIKLGGLSDPKMLLVWGDDGISFKIASDGDSLNANPFAALCEIQSGLGISEIWVSNSEADEKSITVMAIE